MKTSLLIIGFLLFVGLSAFDTFDYQEKTDGKEIFNNNKCSGCHAVESQGITAKSKTKAPDLSEAGKYEENFIEKFLIKKEKINNKLHPIAFKGTDQELETLASWLSTLKEENKGVKEQADTVKSEKQ